MRAHFVHYPVQPAANSLLSRGKERGYNAVRMVDAARRGQASRTVRWR